MTNVFQTSYRQTTSSLALAGYGRNGGGVRGLVSGRVPQSSDDAEYHLVFASITALFVGGTTLVLTALAHAF
jgi:hypothetical protein